MYKLVPLLRHRTLAFGIVGCLALPGVVQAQEDVLMIEGTRIRGDQESPTVLYLVPWQPPTARNLTQPGGRSMVGYGIRPLERAGFQRLISYHDRFRAIHWPGTIQSGIKPADGEPEVHQDVEQRVNR